MLHLLLQRMTPHLLGLEIQLYCGIEENYIISPYCTLSLKRTAHQHFLDICAHYSAVPVTFSITNTEQIICGLTQMILTMLTS